MNLEAIPTAYILLDGGARSSVEVISNTSPIPMNKHDIILAHALAGEYLGNKLLFLTKMMLRKNPEDRITINELYVFHYIKQIKTDQPPYIPK